MTKPRNHGLRVLTGGSATGRAQAHPRKEDRSDSSAEPDLTVVLPDDPPLLTPLAAEALLRLIQHVAAERDQAHGDEGRAA
jgi:hypothetical protein